MTPPTTAAPAPPRAARLARIAHLRAACAPGGVIDASRPHGAPAATAYFETNGIESQVGGHDHLGQAALLRADAYLIATTRGESGLSTLGRDCPVGLELTAWATEPEAVAFAQRLLVDRAESVRVEPVVFHVTPAGVTAHPLAMTVTVARTQATPVATAHAATEVAAHGR